MAANNDDFKDLTEEDQPVDAGKQKKAKAPKAAKAPKQSKAQAEDEAASKKEKKEKKGKKGKGKKIKLLLILLLIIIIGAFIFVEFIRPSMSILGVREFLFQSVARLDPDNVSIEERTEELNERETAIDAREGAAALRETQLDTRRAQLDAREAEIRERERRLIPVYRRNMTTQELEDMQSLSNRYAMMSPERAAEILTELHNAPDIAAILYFMGDRGAAAVLAAFETEIAAEITTILLYD